MNIPKSTIEPFGVIGIPNVRLDEFTLRNNIIDALKDYSDEFYRKFYGIRDNNNRGIDIIRLALIRIALANGAMHVWCKPKVYPSQVIFSVGYRVHHSGKQWTFGLGIKKL